MGYSANTAIQLQIRKIIFEKYNDPNVRFTNDEIFNILQKDGNIDKSITIDDVEPYFAELCKLGLMRNIAQNFTTQWFKLFEPLEAIKCSSCQTQSHISKSEEKNCPSCKTAI
jgi:hypothetical protein